MKVYIITSAKYEECYIEEWVQYHLNIGFDKIIINDNNPKDYKYQLKDILKKYIDEGKVIIERYYDTHNKNDVDEQLIPNAYYWLYNKYKDEFDWFAKLDIDEYLEIPETNNDIKKFLQQDKFNNALSIILNFISYKVKDEYEEYYVRLKNNRDRFIKKSDCFHFIYDFKSIIKKSEYLCGISLHFAFFNDHNDNLINYVFSNGDDASKVIGFDLYSDEIVNNNLRNLNKKYLDQLVYSCHINHYCCYSIEEQVNHCIKFEANNYKKWCMHDTYINLYNEYKEMFDHPRDLYKIYFIDNKDE